ncbi:MAG: hypothetical protein AABX01_07530 [Candidatus Micrarchaeota archaeon]
MAEELPSWDVVHKSLSASLLEEANRHGVPPKYVEKINLLFRHSLIVPSIKHPREIMGSLSKRLAVPGRANGLSDVRLMALVDRALCHDPGYWNAMKVWDTPRMPKQRTAFSPRWQQLILEKLAEIK